jgi:hypothetical protein
MIRDLLGIGEDPADRLLKLFVKAGLLVGLATAPVCLAWGKGRSWLEFWLGPLAGFWLLLTILVHNPLYYRMLAPFIIAGALIALTQLAAVRPGFTALLGLLVVSTWLASGYIFWRDNFVLLTLPADQQPGFQAQHLPRVVPKGSRVFAHGSWWFLGGTCQFFDAWNAHPDMSTIDYVVLETGEVFRSRDRGWMPQGVPWSREDRLGLVADRVVRSGDGADASVPAGRPGGESILAKDRLGLDQSAADGTWCADYLINHNIADPERSYMCRAFRVVEDRTNHEPYQVLGRPLFRRQKGFGCLVLKRREP